MHVVDDVPPVDDDRRRSRRAQRDVQHRPVLGDVDAIATEHRRDPIVAACALAASANSRSSVSSGDAMLRVVEVEPGRLGDEPLARDRVGREQRSQMNRAHLVGVRLRARATREASVSGGVGVAAASAGAVVMRFASRREDWLLRRLPLQHTLQRSSSPYPPPPGRGVRPRSPLLARTSLGDRP